MSWHNGLILSQDELDRAKAHSVPTFLITRFNVGDWVAVHVLQPNGHYTDIQGRVAEVCVGIGMVHYYIAFAVGPGIYAKCGPFREGVTHLGEPAEAGPLTPIDEVVRHLPERSEPKGRVALHSVDTKPPQD